MMQGFSHQAFSTTAFSVNSFSIDADVNVVPATVVPWGHGGVRQNKPLWQEQELRLKRQRKNHAILIATILN